MHISSKHSGGIRWACVSLLVCFFVLMPVVYRGGESWWLPSALAVLFAAGIIWFLCRLLFGERVHRGQLPMPSLHFDRLYLIFLIPIALGLFQLLPLGRFLTGFFSHHARDLWQTVVAVPRISLFPEETLERVLMLFGCMTVVFFTRNFCRHHRYLNAALWCVMLCALLNALIGFWQLINPVAANASPLTPLAGEEHQSIGGSFLNRNHFAFLMVMGICSTCAILMKATTKTMAPGNSAVGMMERQRRAILNCFLVVVLFLLYSATLICLSRAGFLTANLALLALGGVWFYRPKSHHHHHHHHHEENPEETRRRKNTVAMIAVFVTAVFCSLPFVLERISERFDTMMNSDSITGDDRVRIWGASARLIGDYWLTGTGLGAYGDGVQAEAFSDMCKAQIVHAHNDYLEAIAEMGIPVSLLLAYLLYLVGKRIWRGLRKCEDPATRYIAYSVAISIAAGAIHEFFEYNLQAYPNAFAYSLLFGVLLAVTEPRKTVTATPVQETPESPKEEGGSRKTLKRHLAHYHVAYMLVCAVLCLAYSVHCMGNGIAKHRLWLVQEPEYHPMGQSEVPPSRRMKIAEASWAHWPESAYVCANYAKELIGAGNRTKDLGDRLDYWEKAFDMQGKALDRRPSSFQAWEVYGMIAYSLGYKDMAFQSLEHAVALAPTLNPLKLTLAQYYQRAGRRRQAIELRRQVLDTQKDLSIELLPELLTPETPLADFLEDCKPDAALAYAIAERLFLQHRLEELADFLQRWPALKAALPEESEEEEDPSRKHDPKREMNDLQYASFQLQIANVQGKTAEALPRYLAALRMSKEAEKLPEVRTMRELEFLADKFEKEPAGGLPSQQLAVATTLQKAAQNSAVSTVLLPMCYPERPWTLSREEWYQLTELVDKHHADLNKNEGFRSAALQALSNLQLAEVTEDDTLRAEAYGRIAELDKHLRQSRGQTANSVGLLLNAVSWRQRHILDYYLGKASMESGNLQEAEEHFRRMLELYPSNALALKGLAALGTTEGLTDVQLELMPLASLPAMGFVGGVAQVQQLTVTPAVLRNLHDELEVSVTFRVIDGTAQQSAFRVQLSTPEGVFYTAKMVPAESRQNNSMIWENGALVQYKATISNVLTNIVRRQALSAQASVMVEILPGNRYTPALSPRIVSFVSVERGPETPAGN